MEEKRTVQKMLVTVLSDVLKLLHPFMPFITEEIWSNLPTSKTDIIVAEWPVERANWCNEKAEANMELVMSAIRNLRNVRAEMEVAPSRKAKLLVTGSDSLIELFLGNKDYLISLASASEVIDARQSIIPEDAVSVAIDSGELFLPLEELIDFGKEIDRLEKERSKLAQEVERGTAKLANEGFVKKAPDKLIAEEKGKLEKYRSLLDTVDERLKQMHEKMKAME